jgi:hypothetical protein
MVELHVICRSAPGENRKDRPAFYSKDAALRSLVRAAQHAAVHGITFVNDGFIGGERGRIMASHGEIRQLPAAGNPRSYRACIGLVEAADWPDDDIVYFAEDDYLHTDDALLVLSEATARLAAFDYFTLYDHPSYRVRGEQLRWQREWAATTVGERIWQPVLSTTLTFAARVGAIRRDSWAHHICSRDGQAPADQALWSILQGSPRGYLVAQALRPSVHPDLRSLLKGWLTGSVRTGPNLTCLRPGLATHLEIGKLASEVDWAEVASGGTND